MAYARRADSVTLSLQHLEGVRLDLSVLLGITVQYLGDFGILYTNTHLRKDTNQHHE